MRLFLITTMLAALLGSGPLYAQNSANFVVRGCRDALSDDPKRMAYVEAGICIGTVKTLVFLGDVACLELKRTGVSPRTGALKSPRGFTTEQAMRIVVRYIESHPERTQEYFYTMAMQAFVEAWPCPR